MPFMVDYDEFRDEDFPGHFDNPNYDVPMTDTTEGLDDSHPAFNPFPSVQ